MLSLLSVTTPVASVQAQITFVPLDPYVTVPAQVVESPGARLAMVQLALGVSPDDGGWDRFLYRFTTKLLAVVSPLFLTVAVMVT